MIISTFIDVTEIKILKNYAKFINALISYLKFTLELIKILPESI